MPFPESIKMEAKKKSHYKCCICESFEQLQIHHIKPEEDGGPSTLKNAAPLCCRCHDAYGMNPLKRKWIAEKRDFWWEFCERKLGNENLKLIEQAYKTIERVAAGQEKMEHDLSTLKTAMLYFQNDAAQLMAKLDKSPESERAVLYAQVSSSTHVVSGTTSAITSIKKL